MKNSIFHFIILLVSLVILQVTVFNNIGMRGFANPYIYILFILILPLDVKGWVLLVSALAIGMIIDIFGNTPGLHTATTLMLAFIRPFFIRLVSGHSDFEPGSLPMFSNKGQRWIFTYIVLLVIVHHIILFYLEVFHFRAFFITLFDALLSAFFSSLLIILGIYLIDKPSKHR